MLLLKDHSIDGKVFLRMSREVQSEYSIRDEISQWKFRFIEWLRDLDKDTLPNVDQNAGEGRWLGLFSEREKSKLVDFNRRQEMQDLPKGWFWSIVADEWAAQTRHQPKNRKSKKHLHRKWPPTHRHGGQMSQERFASSSLRDFILEEELCRGTHASIWKVKFKYDGKRYVLKELKLNGKISQRNAYK
jgi:hypothetical protein